MFLRRSLLAAAVVLVGMAAHAQTATRADAEGMVKKAIAFAKANGNDKAFAEINNPQGRFIKGELYVFVYDLKGKVLAHGSNPKMIGKDLIMAVDADSKFYVQERVAIVKKSGKGWQDYKFPHPETKKIEAKQAYLEGYNDLIFGCGIYASTK